MNRRVFPLHCNKNFISIIPPLCYSNSGRQYDIPRSRDPDHQDIYQLGRILQTIRPRREEETADAYEVRLRDYLERARFNEVRRDDVVGVAVQRSVRQRVDDYIDTFATEAREQNSFEDTRHRLATGLNAGETEQLEMALRAAELPSAIDPRNQHIHDLGRALAYAYSYSPGTPAVRHRQELQDTLDTVNPDGWEGFMADPLSYRPPKIDEDSPILRFTEDGYRTLLGEMLRTDYTEEPVIRDEIIAVAMQHTTQQWIQEYLDTFASERPISPQLRQTIAKGWDARAREQLRVALEDAGHHLDDITPPITQGIFFK